MEGAATAEKGATKGCLVGCICHVHGKWVYAKTSDVPLDSCACFPLCCDFSCNVSVPDVCHLHACLCFQMPTKALLVLCYCGSGVWLCYLAAGIPYVDASAVCSSVRLHCMLFLGCLHLQGCWCASGMMLKNDLMHAFHT